MSKVSSAYVRSVKLFGTHPLIYPHLSHRYALTESHDDLDSLEKGLKTPSQQQQQQDANGADGANGAKDSAESSPETTPDKSGSAKGKHCRIITYNELLFCHSFQFLIFVMYYATYEKHHLFWLFLPLVIYELCGVTIQSCTNSKYIVPINTLL